MNSAILFIGYRRMLHTGPSNRSTSTSRSDDKTVSYSKDVKSYYLHTSVSGATSRRYGSNKSFSSGKYNSDFMSYSTTSNGTRI
jgi:hypothetical protein